ncbi:MAG TPA: chemotaxis protein CheB [Gemmatimonadaceae bacterium]|jgi:two-component system chemotaxis response regulator CheB|nr:chemotaxis protein CheB [Gemmatimonadaceae bacterium]
MGYAVATVGTSWGGLAALSKLLGALPADFNVPLAIVQHRGQDSERLLTELLQDATDLAVCEIEDKSPLTPGTVHVAPANYHVLIEDGYFSLTIEEPVRFSRPSIDVMFTSAADTYRSRVIGIVLTGANEDGSRGLAHIAAIGGKALVQDPRTAEIPIMPEAAIRAVPSAEVIPLNELAPRLIQLSGEGKKSARKVGV